MKSKKSIMLVEDDLVDTMTVKRALKEIKVTNGIVTAENGEEALKYLNNEENELPCIILLDLNMPRMNGIEFLHAIKKIVRLKRKQVIVLTTSGKAQKYRINSFNLGIAGYMMKPVDYLQFVEVVKAIDLYWSLSELAE